jgi:hypothetical protein
VHQIHVQRARCKHGDGIIQRRSDPLMQRQSN